MPHSALGAAHWLDDAQLLPTAALHPCLAAHHFQAGTPFRLQLIISLPLAPPDPVLHLRLSSPTPAATCPSAAQLHTRVNCTQASLQLLCTGQGLVGGRLQACPRAACRCGADCSVPAQLVYFLTIWSLPNEFTGIYASDPTRIVKNWHPFVCVAAGLWGGLIIGITTEYYTSNRYSPVQVCPAARPLGCPALVQAAPFYSLVWRSLCR